MSEASRAVFLSYASQDAVAAKRICDSLRAAGVEVWFDQSELRGGDSWDQKIRRQIKECALFVPVISASTQSRREGYFRREWKLAVDRTHDMDEGLPFLVPVVIDGTNDAEAFVPEKFREVQWTRLRDGATGPDFCARVRRLMNPESMDPIFARGPARETASRDTDGHAGDLWKTPAFWGGLLLLVVGTVVFIAFRSPGPSPGNATVATHGTTAPGSANNDTLSRVHATLESADATRAQLDLAGEILAQASRNDPTNATLLATWAVVDCRCLDEWYDASPERRDAAQRHATQAFSLDPALVTTRLARAMTIRRLSREKSAAAEAVTILRQLIQEVPNDWHITLELAWALFQEGDHAGGLGLAQRATRSPESAAEALHSMGLMHCGRHEYAEAARCFDEASAGQPAAKFLSWKAYLQLIWLGDVAGAQRTIRQISPAQFSEDMAGSAKNFVDFWARDYEARVGDHAGHSARLRAIKRRRVSGGLLPRIRAFTPRSEGGGRIGVARSADSG